MIPEHNAGMAPPPPRVRRGFLVGAALAVALAGSSLLWLPALRRALALHSARPCADVLAARVSRAAADPAPEIEALWRSGHIPQRLVALNFARESCVRDRTLAPRLRPLLVAALHDGDQEVAELAAAVLEYSGSLVDLAALVPLLQDADSAMRLLALKSLRLKGAPAFSPAVVPLLADPDARVSVAAATCLRAWHQVDFGVRANLDVAGNAAGLQRWREWALAQQGAGTLPASPAVPVFPPSPRRRAPAFSVATLSGGRVELQGLLGKVVLLHFWHSAEPESQSQLADLGRLESRFDGKLVLLHILVDKVPTEHEEPEACPVDAHDGSHAHGASRAEDLAAAAPRIQREQGAGGALVVDDGALATAYICRDLPTTVIIGPDGTVRRRLIGKRSGDTLDALVRDALLVPP